MSDFDDPNSDQRATMNLKQRVASWNIGCGLFVDDGNATFEERTQYVAKRIAELDVDIVAFQEMTFSNTGDSPFLNAVASSSGLTHVVAGVLSASHLVENSKLGLAIISRYPIVESQLKFLPTPSLAMTDELGNPGILHQKGVLISRIRGSNFDFDCICGHLPPFRLLPKDPRSSCFAEMWSTLDSIFAGLSRPFVALMDINLASALEFLPLSQSKRILQCIHEATRPSGDQNDQILCSHDWCEVAVKVLPSRFDHHLCFASMTNITQSPAHSSRAEGDFVSASILHLSDLHFGPGGADDVDWKTYVPFATRETRKDRFVQHVRALPQPPDFVVVSGDITIAGKSEGFEEFSRVIDQLVESGHLPSVNRILVVPGNHDVKRQATSVRARWENFAACACRFAHPLLGDTADLGDRIQVRVRTELANKQSIIGGAWWEEDPKTRNRFCYSIPFLLDRRCGLIMYGFNSASISGVKLDVPQTVDAAIGRLREMRGKTGEDVDLVLRELDRQLWVDPSRVDPAELNLFGTLTDLLRSEIEDFDSFTKIAVLHHHVGPVVPEEVTKFEGLLNAGRFKRELLDAGFDIILHGHKHYPGVRIEIDPDRSKSQLIISGGTVGGGVGAASEPGFHLLQLSKSRRTIRANFVPVRAVGSPIATVAEALAVKRTYPLRITRSMLDGLDHIALQPIFEQSRNSLLHFVRQTEIGGIPHIGWSHALDEERVSIIATAYGLATLHLIGETNAQVNDLVRELVFTLQKFQNSDGGWSASSQGTISRPEPTAYVIDALSDWGAIDLSDAIDCLERMLDRDDTSWSSTYSIARVSRTLARCKPNSAVLERCSLALLNGAYRDENGCYLYWSQNLPVKNVANYDFARGVPSIVHTAHAAISILSLFNATAGNCGVSPEKLGHVLRWMLKQQRWDNTSEDINRRRSDGRYDSLVVKHFTSPWGIVAAIQLGADLHQERVRREINFLAQKHLDGLWDWGATRRPIWATHDALLALRKFAQASL